MQQEEEQKQGALYDKNLFAEEIGADDDIDFDWMFKTNIWFIYPF